MPPSQRTSYRPWSTFHSHPSSSPAARGKSPGRQRRPRSSTITEKPAWARRAAATAPPKPLPTTMASASGWVTLAPFVGCWPADPCSPGRGGGRFRSPDLCEEVANEFGDLVHRGLQEEVPAGQQVDLRVGQVAGEGACPLGTEDLVTLARSEEHTSELQSRGHLVC